MNDRREAIDVDLLRVLYAVLTERSVTRAAGKLGQSQPAISAALKKLREISGDVLLVHLKGSIGLTPYGRQLLATATQALQQIELIVAPQRPFNALRSTRCYRVGCPDYFNAFLVPVLTEHFRDAAPQASLEFHALGPSFDYEAALEEGRLDVVIGDWPEPPKQLHCDDLFADQVVCLVSKDHPFARGRAPTIEQYLDATHAAAIVYSPSRRGTIDLILSRLRRKRHVAVTLPSLNVAPYVLLQSDLVLTTNRIFAEYYSKILPVAIVSAPMEFTKIQYYQLWHERSHYSPEVRWLRGVISAAVRSLLASAGGSVMIEKSPETECPVHVLSLAMQSVPSAHETHRESMAHR
jgi:DNA-binding transcriptional LysR family regulator